MGNMALSKTIGKLRPAFGNSARLLLVGLGHACVRPSTIPERTVTTTSSAPGPVRLHRAETSTKKLPHMQKPHLYAAVESATVVSIEVAANAAFRATLAARSFRMSSASRITATPEFFRIMGGKN